ncbi:phosphatidylinositol-3-phosphatase Ymr1 [Malassezia pachydermatis]
MALLTRQISPSYPATLVVPSNISDNTLLSAAKHRSKGRVPTLTYLHWANNASLSRSSQPMVGMTQNRSSQDEKLVEAIFASHRYTTEPASETAVYGATTTNLIVDARPTTNAMANHAKGAGSENMEHYKDCKKVYLGIDNIHVMRVSLNKVHAALRAADEKTMFDERTEPEPVDASLLMRSQWLKHSSAILQGVQQIVRNIHIHSSHVLVHCSDGWDRTAQLSSLAALCLDPYYRTFVGFVVLIEKDWLSFGHQFQERHGLVGLASNRFDLRAPQHDLVFDADVSEDERVNDSQGTSQSFWDFTKSITAHFQGGAAAQCAPIFFQFLDCVWQIQRQFPARFEFTSEWLTILMKCIYDGRSASFLFNSERERRTPSLTSTLPPCEVAPSVWDLDLQREQYRQPLYDPSLDAREGRGDQGVILPEPKDVRFSPDLFRRRDSELNVLVDVEKESQTRLKERLATASRGGHTKHVAPPSTVQADPLIPEEALHNAARSVRALFSDGWGRVQEAMRATGLDASPFAPTENQATDFVPPQSVDNPWASHTLDEPVAGLHTLSLESTHSEQTAYNNDTASVIPTSSADPLGAWKI